VLYPWFEIEVKSWREAGILPYPDFPEEIAWEGKDTLDFPPKGSPDQNPADRQG
jgi:hypothetical protein